MRLGAQHIQDVWDSGGPFIGDNGKAHSRVTVQAPWSDLSGDHKYDVVRTTYDVGVGKYSQRGVPLRWVQNAAQTQVEIEVPNVRSVHISRAIDQDSAAVEIALYNQQMFNNASVPANATTAGQPGYYTFSRGISIDAQSRWGQTSNSWENILVPNALIRTYQGFGGNSKTISAALTDGNLLVTGTWLLDTVEVHSDGTLQLKGRDLAKLLLDQQLYLPLIPKDRYPLTYFRYQYFNEPINAGVTGGNAEVFAGDKSTIYETSSVDAWYDSIYGHDSDIHGHHPSQAFDGDHETYFLGEGNSRPNANFAVNYLQATCGEQMNAVYIDPWAGNYTMYVSVMENGVWQGTSIVPYSDAELVGTQSYVVDTGAAIPYVASFAVPWETAQDYILPRMYVADRVRVSFRDLTYTPYGPWQYRAGIREFKIRASQDGSTNSTQIVDPIFIAADEHPGDGYITADINWQFDAFGDARLQPLTGGQPQNSDPLWCLRFTPSGNGYYVMTSTGRVTCYGDAVYHGDPQSDGYTTSLNDNCSDMAVSNTGNGYWILDTVGRIHAYGDATAYPGVVPSSSPQGQTFAHSIDSHPTTQGVWVLDANGTVFTRGGCTNFGNFTPLFNVPKGTEAEFAVRLRSTHDGTGYWIMSSAGKVEAKGSASTYPAVGAHGYDPWWYLVYWALLPHSDDSGYLVMQGNGQITDFGLSPATWDFGSPVPGTTSQLRKDGNYLDYSDIIKDLALWAGFLLYDPSVPANGWPAVHGNIESTGAFAYEDLPPDLFDKRPVIDPMHTLKETVGYLLWVDEEGALRFQSPNWWAPGNFDEDGNHLNEVINVDEKVSLIDYSATVADEPLRSQIIISSEDPDQALNTTVTTRLIPNTARRLRGLVKPAMWVNGYFLRPQEQKIMAELIALHINFQSRIGQVTCVANPCIQIDDQVRIFEQQTAETYIHYVRGIDSTHDLDTGEYTMTLTTHWLGDESEWAIQQASSFTGQTNPDNPNVVYTISDALVAALRNQMGSAAANEFGFQTQAPITSVVPGSQTGTGAAK